MTQRPVRRSPGAVLEDGTQPQAAVRPLIDGRKVRGGHPRLKFEALRLVAHGDFRRARVLQMRHALAIAAEAMNGPLRRWREIELDITRSIIRAQERLEAGMLPEPMR